MTTPEDEVLAANEAFYAAFDRRDLETMSDCWAQGVRVSCIHPGWPVLTGRATVLRSWQRILSSASSPRVSCRDTVALLLGESAVVTCTEVVQGTALAATNYFLREEGAWRLVHHQAGPVTRDMPARRATRRPRSQPN